MRYLPLFLLLITGQLFAQRSTGYNPMPGGKYDSIRIPFMNSEGTKNLPANHIISENFFPPVGEQGEFGSCVAWATGYALGSFYFSAKNQWGKPNDLSKIMSPSFVYHQIRECNCGPDCGTYIGDALELMKTKGITSWQSMPYDLNNCNLPNQSMMNLASSNKIKGYNRLKNRLNLNEYKSYLSNDVPVIIGSSLGVNFDYYGPKSGVFNCTQLEQNSGHAMLIVGYDDNKRAFKIMNSWGKDWGENGHIWVEYECFKLMMSDNGSEAYVISKDYELSTTKPDDYVNVDTIDVPTVEPTNDENIDEEYEVFHPFGYYEELAENQYYVAYGLIINPEIQPYVEKVVYVFDHPDFYNKYVRSTEAPYFLTAFEGPTCLEEMKAIVVLTDGSRYKVEFDGCAVLEEGYESEYVEIIPNVNAIPIPNNPGYYNFTIELRGAEELKDQIVKVVYDFNHSSFSNRYITVSNSTNGYQTSYNGWGCLDGLGVTIYYNDDSSEYLTIDMCEELGW